MHLNKNIKNLSVICFLVIILGACGGPSRQPSERLSEKTLYLKNNIHAQQGRLDTKASYANWTNTGTGHIVIPVNTPVEIGRFRRGFALNNLTNNQMVYYEFNEENMKMNIDQYINLITSPNKVNLSGLSPIDQKGIKDGKAYPGMSKDAVRMSLGYPAAHATPSLEENTWIYWTNRFKTMKVEFGEDGKVKRSPHAE